MECPHPCGKYPDQWLCLGTLATIAAGFDTGHLAWPVATREWGWAHRARGLGAVVGRLAGTGLRHFAVRRDSWFVHDGSP